MQTFDLNEYRVVKKTVSDHEKVGCKSRKQIFFYLVTHGGFSFVTVIFFHSLSVIPVNYSRSWTSFHGPSYTGIVGMKIEMRASRLMRPKVVILIQKDDELLTAKK